MGKPSQDWEWSTSAKEEELKWSEEASSCVSRVLDEMGRKGWMKPASVIALRNAAAGPLRVESKA
jgi:hypothetical protein